MAKILVTGGAGFVGSHLCEFLASSGHEVVAIDCLTDYYDKGLKIKNMEEVKKSGVGFYGFDLAERGFIEQMSSDFEYIYHLAAQPGISEKVSLETYIRNNVVATQNLLEFAESIGSLKLFVNICTSSVYGLVATAPETDAPAPVSFYGVSKLAGEQLVLSGARQGKLAACSVRLYSVYGPRERPEKFYYKLIKNIIDGEATPFFEGSENHSRSFTYVGDVVEGLGLLMESSERCVGEVLNMGSDREVKVSEGIRIIEEALGQKARLDMRPARTGDQLQTRAVIDKARGLLGYEPKVELKDGLLEQIKWYKENFD